MNAEFPSKLNEGIKEPLTLEGFPPDYRVFDEILIKELLRRLPDGFVFVDVATRGLVPQLLREESEKLGKKGEIIEGRGKISDEKVDGISMFDPIYGTADIEEKRKILPSMIDLLKPEGILALGSPFFRRSSMRLKANEWEEWKLRSLDILGFRKEEIVRENESFDPEEYRKMLEESGLRVFNESRKIVEFSHAELVAFSKNPDFIKEFFHDVDMAGQEDQLQNKSQALIKALNGVDSLRSGWYHIIAQKPPSEPVAA